MSQLMLVGAGGAASGGAGPSAYQTAVLADSPVWYCRMGGASSPLADLSGNGADLVMTGGTLGSAGLLVGDTDNAVAFSPPGYGIAPYNPAHVTGGTVSVEAIIKLNTTAHANWIMQRGAQLSGAFYGFNLFIDTGGQICFGHPESGNIATGSSLSTGTSYHIVATVDHGTADAHVYLNGADVTASVPDPRMFNVAPNTIGEDLYISRRLAAGSVNDMDGTIDEPAFYGTILSPTRVGVHYTASGI